MFGAPRHPAIHRHLVDAFIALGIVAWAAFTAAGQAVAWTPEVDDLILPYLAPSDAPQARQGEREMVSLARQGRLDAAGLAEASLLVEGSEGAARIGDLREKLAQWSAELAKDSAGDSRAKAERILQFLHRQVLKGGYEANTSSLIATLKDGRYNCVSASLLFLALAEKQGLSVSGVQRPGHVFCRVFSNEEWLDVETTCAKCGVPAHRGEVSGARSVSAAEFLAKCYYNLGMIHLQARRFRNAIACCALAWQLDPQDDRARDNLLASLNNGALQRCEMGDFAGAESLLARARRISASYGPLVANEAYLARLRVARLCSDERFTEALSVVAELRARRPESVVAMALEAQIRRQFPAGEASLVGSGSSSAEVRFEAGHPLRQNADSPRDLTVPGF